MTDEMQEQNGYKVRIIDENKRRSLRLSELQGLDILTTPAWVYRQKKKEIPWANSEAMQLYFKRKSLDENKSQDTSTTNINDTIRFYAMVEETGCTVHIVGPRRILLAGVKTTSKTSKNDDEIVTLIVSPIEIVNGDNVAQNAALFHEISTNNNFEVQEKPFDIQANNTPMDIILQMLNELSAGFKVPAVHAKKIRDVLLEGHDINQPIIFANSFILSKKNEERKNNIKNILGISTTDTKPKKIEYSLSSIDKTNIKSYTNYTNLTDEMLDFWNFNAFEIDKVINGHLLAKMAMKFFDKHDIINILDLNRDKLVKFVIEVEKGYSKDILYHNSLHAASVLHCTNMIMVNSNVAQKLSNDPTSYAMILLASYIAAIIHDYLHKGVSNKFLIETASPLAIVYNDLSPMENHHTAAAFHLLFNEQYNFLENFTKTRSRIFRNTIINMVLNTDMQHHFAIITKFKARISYFNEKACWNLEESDSTLVMQMVLKCSDMSHLLYDFNLHKKWVERLQEEMFLQGDKEKQLGLPISPLYDRNKDGIVSSQTDFIDFVAMNMFKLMIQEFKELEPMLNLLTNNYNQWNDYENWSDCVEA